MSLADKTSELISYLKEIEANQSPIAFACSFGAEDMVLLDAIARHARKIEIFTLDTGRLPEETQELFEAVRDKYPIAIRTYFPDTATVQAWVEQNGPNAFYKSVAQRLQCCHIRKVEPLRRALAGKKSWITGLRREQSQARMASSRSIHSWNGETPTCGTTSERTACHTTHYMTAGIPVSVARRAREPYNRVKTSGPAAGGGRQRRRSAAYTSMQTHCSDGL